MNRRFFKLHLMVAATILLLPGVTEVKEVDWETLDHTVNG